MVKLIDTAETQNKVEARREQTRSDDKRNKVGLEAWETQRRNREECEDDHCCHNRLF